MTPRIRPFIHDDAPALAELTVAAIAITAASVYSVKQVLSWAARHPGAPRYIASAEKGDRILVALTEDEAPAAYTLMEADGHIDMLYCSPDHGGKGIASALLEAIEADARRAGIGRLFTEASELARPVFARADFAMLHRRDFTIAMGDEHIPIHNYAMEKVLG